METWRQKIERKTMEERAKREREKLRLAQLNTSREEEGLPIHAENMFIGEEPMVRVQQEVTITAKQRSVEGTSSPNSSSGDILAKSDPPPSGTKSSVSGYAGLVSAKKRKRLTEGESRALENSTPAGRERVELNEDANREIGDKDQTTPSGYAPIRKKPREKKEAVYVKRGIVETRPNNGRPAWYANVGPPSKRAHVLGVAAVNDMIQRCILAHEQKEDTTGHMKELRDQIHKMEFWTWLNQRIVMDSKVLEAKGLVRIFNEPHQKNFPFDIKADASALYGRWHAGDVVPDLLRGVKIEKGKLASGQNRRSYSLDKEYKYRKTSYAIGNNDLVNGQWWPIRICAMRDGAHGEQEAGISGKSGHGAYSVVVAQGGYADLDRGESIEYCGTESERPTPTKNTQLMLDSQEKKIPVRVLRSKNKKSKYAPSDGLRYDGLYDIVGNEILNEKTAMYRFSLMRQEGQDPIRYQGPEARPTVEELHEKETIQHLVSNTQI